MKRRIAYISIFFTIVFLMLSCSAYAANVLIISEEDVVNGKSVADILTKISLADHTIEEKSIDSGKSLAQTADEIEVSGKAYDRVIIQLPFDSKESVADITSAMNTLYTKLGSTENTQYLLGTPTGSITEYDKNIVTAKENVKNIMTGMTAKKVASIPVYENLKKAQDNSLDMYSNGKTTPLGNLLVACTYYNSLGKNVESLSSYEGLIDSEVVKVVGIANESGTPVAEKPTTGTVVEEPTKEPEEKIDEDTDVTEVVGSAVVGINREPIVEMVTSDPTGLKIRIYDKEKAGIKTASLTINDANGEKIEPDSIEGEKVKSYVYVIKKELLNTEEYKQFYIYAEDNDGCILREYFRVKYSENADNGSNYKVNRAPRIRPKLFTDSELETVNNISLYVMDQTGVQRVTPKTVEENGLKEVNLYADGKYNGYDGIEGNYEWRDVKGKTTTSSKTYVKEAYTQFQNINEFFKYENTENKVSLLLGDNKYRFNAHAVDATGLATDKIMIIDFSNGKKEENDGDDGADKTSSAIPTSSKETTNDNNTNDTANNTNNVNNTNNTGNENKTSEENGELQESESTPGYAHVKADREPRLEYVNSKDYLYIEIRDMAGIACAYPSIDTNRRFEAQKSLEPQVYRYDNDKRGDAVKVKRPAEEDYQKFGKVFKYRVGIPVTEFSEEYKKFEVVAYDVTSKTKQQFYIDEVFMAKKSEDGEILVNRAPTSNINLLRSNWSQMCMRAVDATGVSVLELRTLPKAVGKPADCIRSWSGKVQSNWSAVTFLTSNGKYVKDGLTKFERINDVFKANNWVGLNPKVAGKDGVYLVAVAAADASGARSIKTMKIDTKYYISGDEYEETGNSDNGSNDVKSSEKSDSSKEEKEKEQENNPEENTNQNTEAENNSGENKEDVQNDNTTNTSSSKKNNTSNASASKKTNSSNTSSNKKSQTKESSNKSSKTANNNTSKSNSTTNTNNKTNSSSNNKSSGKIKGVIRQITASRTTFGTELDKNGNVIGRNTVLTAHFDPANTTEKNTRWTVLENSEYVKITAGTYANKGQLLVERNKNKDSKFKKDQKFKVKIQAESTETKSKQTIILYVTYVGTDTIKNAKELKITSSNGSIFAIGQYDNITKFPNKITLTANKDVDWSYTNINGNYKINNKVQNIVMVRKNKREITFIIDNNNKYSKKQQFDIRVTAKAKSPSATVTKTIKVYFPATKK